MPTARKAARRGRVCSCAPTHVKAVRSTLPLSPRVSARQVCVAEFLDTVTFAAGALSPPMRGTTPTSYRERTCARARGGVRWGSMVNALGFQRRCYMVTGHLRARHVLGKTPFLDEVTCASPGHESTWRFGPDQQKPPNKCFRRKALPNMDLGLFVDGIVGHLDGLFQGLSGTRFSA